jgi:hypothetical protein
MSTVTVSHWVLPGPRVTAEKMTPKEAALAGAIGIVPGTTSTREVREEHPERKPLQGRAGVSATHATASA